VLIASNHRSYFDVAALGILAAGLGRPVRFLAKKELFDAPGLGWLATSLGGICVDRKGTPRKAFDEADAALQAGDVVIVLPQGTIPRGEAFFRAKLEGKTGCARLAKSSGAPVIPVGLYGTEEVWPRSSKIPKVNLRHRAKVRIRVGSPLFLTGDDPKKETVRLMAAIGALLPKEARVDRTPSSDELRRSSPKTKDERAS
jgi:putative phosphoserine phosphatase/1-acylglycerol-3-phosphate O-acyltransferase